MKWFKHYTDASEGKTLQSLNRKYGLIGEARYWRLIQLLAKQYTNSSKSFYLSLETIRQTIAVRSLTDARSFLDHLATISELIVNHSGNDCEIIYDKLSEIKDNHTKNLQATRKSMASNLPLDKDKDKEEDKEYIYTTVDVEKSTSQAMDEFSNFKISSQFTTDLVSKKVSAKHYRSWVNAYPDQPWVEHEFYKAAAWLVANPKRAPKNFARFFTSWLSRAHESQRKHISTKNVFNIEENNKKVLESFIANQRKAEGL